MKNIFCKSSFIVLMAATAACSNPKLFTDNDIHLLDSAAVNGTMARQGFIKSSAYLYAWRDLADTVTGLIPRNINEPASRDIWNAKDCAADNYPFMVLTSYLLDRPVFDSTMHKMLETEKKLTSRVGALPDTWSFSKKGFLNPEVNMQDIIFGSAEYVKDGLIPLTEFLGESPWSERMISILDDIWKSPAIETPYGRIPSSDPEVNGDLLQSLSRVYWFTGDKKYLGWAEILGDYYLLGNNHPTKNFEVLRLRDHGCEIVSGLCELYATVSYADKAKKEAYKSSLYEMLDRILEVGRNEDGLFYNSIDPVKGIPVDSALADTWGYTLDGFYTVYLLDQVEKYRQPVITALNALNGKYKNYGWEGRSADGYADAIESALNLYQREPVEQAREWIDSETDVMWRKQLSMGIIEGWHGDGNFARTSIMYSLWKTGGTYVNPWNPYLEFGGVHKDGKLFFSATNSEEDWQGRIFFDTRRHSDNLNLPLDWPRINQFPEYFTIEKDKTYKVSTNYKNKPLRMKGKELLKGLPVKIYKGDVLRFVIQPA